MKKLAAILLIIAMAASVLCACNMQVVDTTYKFDYAYILLPNGEVVEGKVQSWSDFEDGDQLQIKIDGITYLTDTTRAVLVKNK